LATLLEENRLVTIVGAPGIGKTTVALAHMDEVRAAYPGGAWFCDLSSAETVDDVCGSIARALEMPITGPSDTDQLSIKLASALEALGPSLIVLDNVDQLAATIADVVAQWHAAAPCVALLLTSRQRLHVPHEVPLELDPLSVPTGDDDFDQSEAIQLFALRARVARDGYRPSAEDRQALTEVVKQLDGNPLAIELAAARMGILTAQQLAGYLPDRFRLLVTQREGASDRHSTLRAAIDWSWNMLSYWEQSALAQLSVFRGGFTAAAAESVVDLSAYPSAPWIVDVIQALRDKSLLRSEAVADYPDELRFSMYVSIREYARERAERLGVQHAASRRHAAYFAENGAQWGRLFEQTSDPTAGKRLEMEFDNLIVAHRRCLQARKGDLGPVEFALEIAMALDPLLARKGPFGLRHELVRSALEAARDAPIDDDLRARALESRGEGSRSLGRMDDAVRDLEAAASVAKKIDNQRMIGRTQCSIGLARLVQGQLSNAATHLDRAIATARSAGDRRLEGRVLGWLGHVRMVQSEFDAAWTLFGEAIAIQRELGDRRFEGINLHTRAVVAHDSGRLDEARAMYELALDIHREINDAGYASTALANLALIAQEQGRYQDAVDQLESGLETTRTTSDRRVEGVVLGYYARLQQERAPSASVRKTYRRALELLDQWGDAASTGLLHAMMSSLEADLGNITAASEHLERALAMLGELDHDRYIAAARLCGLHLEIAKAKEAGTAGAALDTDVLDELRGRVNAIVAETSGGSLIGRSADVRLSMALVHTRLEEAGDPNSVGTPTDVEQALRIAPDGRWFRLPTGEYVSLHRRRSLRLVMQSLAKASADSPDHPLSVEQLQEAGWPGERMRPDAGARRVYTALWTLRKLGLREILVRTDTGYYLNGRIKLEDDTNDAMR
jgi:predicted ATPase